ncbi:MAG: hypothetical protein RBS16_00215 [Candidatus Cloacimonadales bacterium]|nr:hypothetical protein [Candidatus Cloacimonadota bacterium]MDD3501080.1 hypothetical protein [Candidatus Cloacimonadota bacterium]MDX9976439.1 hypothetical protein [Candidatus Cloacimonadales bacterium]
MNKLDKNNSKNKELLKQIKAICIKQNIIIWSLAFINSIILFLISLQLIFSITLFDDLSPFQEFFIALGVRILLILLIVYLLLKSQKDEVSINHIAYKYDQLVNDKSDTISNALDFCSTKTYGDINIKKRYINNAIMRMKEHKFKYNFYNYKSLILMILVLLTGSCITLFCFKDNYKKAWYLFRARRPEITIHDKTIKVQPENTTISRNSNLKIKIINYEKGLEYNLWTTQDKQWRKELLNDYYKDFYNVENSFYYSIKSEYGSSDTFYVEVLDKPFVKSLNIKINYPSYTKLKPAYLENSDGNITVLNGSQLNFETEVDNIVNSAKIVFQDNTFMSLKRTGKTTWDVDFKANKTQNYHFILTNKLENESQPIPKTLNVVVDAEPQIDVVFPQSDTTLTQNMIFPISFQASDDYGLQNLVIHYLINDNLSHSKLIQKQFTSTFFESDYYLDLDEFMLIPGDEITYWLEVEDNSPQVQKGVSKRQKLKFPSIEEIYQQMEQQETISKDNLEMALKESKLIQEDFERKRRELLRKNIPDADDKSDILEMLKKHDELNKMVDNVAKEYQQMIENLEKNNAANEQILDKMQKIQEIMEEINTPELQSLLHDMQKNINQMSPDFLKKTMEDLKFSLEDFTQSLQQTLDLLESIKKEMNLQKLSELAKEMEKMQSALNDKTSDAKNPSDLTDQQKQIKDMLKQLQDEISKSLDLFDKEKDKEYLQELQQLSNDIDESGLQQDLDESISSLEKNMKQKAQNSQKLSLQKMSQLSKKLEKMQSAISGGDMQEIMETLQKTIKRLILFSKLHEDLSSNFAHDPIPILPEMIANYDGIQMTLQYLYTAPQILMFLGQKYFYDVSQTQNAYRSFFSDMQDNKLHTAKNHMTNIQKGINLIILDLLNTADNMEGGGGSGSMQSFMQQLQQMGQEQLAMNMMTQSIMNQMMQNGNQTSQQMRQQMQRLAAEEQRLADNLNRALQTNPDAQKHTQQIKHLTEELESIAKQLKQGKLDKTLLDRQNNIMSKLLDIEKSIQKREFSQKRKGETANHEDWEVPDNVKSRYKDQQRRNELLENLKTYPKEYQELIKEYLKVIYE